MSVALAGCAHVPAPAPARGAATRSAPPAAATVAASTPVDAEVQPPDPAESPPPPGVIVVAIDGVRWQEIFDGADAALARSHGVDASAYATAEALTPNLHRLVAESGVLLGGPGCDNTVAASGPNFISLPGYMEMLTGQRRSGCTTNECARTTVPSVLDGAREELGADEVAMFTSWTPIERAVLDPNAFVASAGKSFVSHRDALVGDALMRATLETGAKEPSYPGNEGYRPDAQTAKLALRYFELNHPRMMFLGLGDTDEYGHRDDYASYLGAIAQVDRVLGDLETLIEAMGPGAAQTTVLVTADHGRAANFRDHGMFAPESARTFLAAWGGGMRGQGAVCPSRPLHLADVAATVRTLLALAPPQRAHMGEPVAEVVTESPRDALAYDPPPP